MNESPTRPEDVAARMVEHGWHRRSSGEAAEHLRVALQRLGRNKQHAWARLALRRWEHEGARRAWVRVLKARQQRFKSHSGDVLTVAGAYGTPIRNDRGVKTGEFQPHLFREMTRAEVAESLAADVRQRDRLDRNELVKRGLLALWDDYPDAVTVEDVLICAGIDPESGVIEGVV